MKYNIMFAAMLSLGIVGCGTVEKTPSLGDKIEIKQAEVVFLESTGYIKIQYDEKGNWNKLTSGASSSVDANDIRAVDQAILVAAMKAKRNIADFLNNKIKSDKSFNAMVSSYLADVDGGSEADGNGESRKAKAHKIATNVAEKITDSSDHILKGVYVSSRKVDRETALVSVELTVTPHAIITSKQISEDMK